MELKKILIEAGKERNESVLKRNDLFEKLDINELKSKMENLENLVSIFDKVVDLNTEKLLSAMFSSILSLYDEVEKLRNEVDELKNRKCHCKSSSSSPISLNSISEEEESFIKEMIEGM